MITDIRAYAALNTSSLPRFLVRNSANLVVLDTGATAATLAGTSFGVFFVPFRPAQSPDPWMYVAAQQDYQKLSVPDVADVVTQRNVGLAEPTLPPEAAPMQMGLVEFSALAADWTNSGTAGAISDGIRTADTIGDLLPDPVFPSRWSLEVSEDKFYQIGQTLFLDAGFTVLAVIQDVVPPIESVYGIAIEAIYYRSGVAGDCVIVPDQNSISANVPGQQLAPTSDSILSDPVLAGLRRGALVRLSGYGGIEETVLVLSVTKGPTGLFSFECSTTNTFAAGDTIFGLHTIVLEHFGVDDTFSGNPIESRSLDFAITAAGIANVQQTFTNPFTSIFYAGASGLVQTAQLDDYVNFAINLSDPSKLVVGRILFNVGDVIDYSTDFYYAEFTAADLIKDQPTLPPASPAGTETAVPTQEEFIEQNKAVFTPFDDVNQTIREELIRLYNQLYGNVTSPTTDTDTTLYPSSPWVVIQIPIRSLTHGGTNANRTLSNCNGVRVQLQTTDAISAKVGCFWVGGGGQADVGRLGTPYYYAARGRDSRTGVKSNPTPSTRYGVSPRRQRVEVELLDRVLDPQMDTWDIYRFGGTVQSWRYLGSMPNSGTGIDTFVDNFYDTSIIGSGLLERDNFEPWPSIDVPFTLNGTAVIVGTILELTFAASSDIPSNIDRWLPGTLILVDGVAYTLWRRPTSTSALVYVLETAECMGAGTTTDVKSNEPILARQRLLSVFGPDAAGTVFGCGDPLRPGTLSYSKSYDPDSVPDAYNRELVQPSEPLMGGVVIDGLASVASTMRWWDLYPQFGNSAIGAERYQPVERGVGRGIAAPYGYCSDGKRIYFVAKDGIWVKDGSSGYSLTDADLRDLFPHEGVPGFDITYAGLTVHAPDYTRTQTFRLSYCKSYLYFDYEDIYGVRRTLVCDLSRERPSWSVDDYADPITCHYWLEGPENDLNAVTDTYPVLLMGDDADNIYVQRDLTNDNGVPISCALATFEWNGGDVRADQFWGDGMVDALALSGIAATPISNRIASGVSTSIAALSTRQQAVVHSAGIEQKYLGYLLEWTDDFDYLYDITEPTTLYTWQPLYQAVPLRVFTWRTQGTTFGIQGYFHCREVLAAYRSTAPVTLTVTAYDGTSPVDIILPPTGGEERKILFPFSFNKGLLYFFSGTSDAPWYPYFDAWELNVGAWGRTTPYQRFTDVEAPKGIGRSIDE